jgi:hypothetical protein
VHWREDPIDVRARDLGDRSRRAGERVALRDVRVTVMRDDRAPAVIRRTIDLDRGR